MHIDLKEMLSLHKLFYSVVLPGGKNLPSINEDSQLANSLQQLHVANNQQFLKEALLSGHENASMDYHLQNALQRQAKPMHLKYFVFRLQYFLIEVQENFL